MLIHSWPCLTQLRSLGVITIPLPVVEPREHTLIEIEVVHLMKILKQGTQQGTLSPRGHPLIE